MRSFDNTNENNNDNNNDDDNNDNNNDYDNKAFYYAEYCKRRELC